MKASDTKEAKKRGRPPIRNYYSFVGDMVLMYVRVKPGETICYIDRADWPKVHAVPNGWRARWVEGCGTYYVYTQIDGKYVQLHRFIMDAPAGMDVDHINHNGLDNRRASLRLATRQQNSLNRRGASSHSKTGHRGIHIHASGKYRVCICVAGKRHELGMFENLQDAIEARTAWVAKNPEVAKWESSAKQVSR